MKKKLLFILTLITMFALLLSACGSDATEAPAQEEPAAEEPAAEEPVADTMEIEATLTIESWRNDDLAIWQDLIIPRLKLSLPPQPRLNTMAH